MTGPAVVAAAQCARREVGDGVRAAVDHEQARLIAAARRCLGDQTVGQFVVEKVGFQRHEGMEWPGPAVLATFISGTGTEPGGYGPSIYLLNRA